MQKLSLIFLTLLIIIFTGCQSPDLSGKKVKKTYFTGGQTQSEFIMDDATEQNGILKKYGYNGNITSISHIKNGVNNGLDTGYDAKGRVIWKRNYVNGKIEGREEAYYPNGDVMIVYNYLNGMKHGKAYTYNIDGSVNKTARYQHNKKIG